jgi:2-polyprenyl-3-methyl-5-hydroxy-6-metoxy-1,4-benzoquinol methylase
VSQASPNPADPASALSAERQNAYTGVRTGLAALVPTQARNLLDLGCSDGSLGAYLKASQPALRVCGAEYQAELAARAATRLDRALHLDLRDPLALQAWAPERFDCVVAADVLEHLPDPDALLATLPALLNPGASLVVSLPNIRHLSALWAIYARGEFPRRERGIFDATHLRWFTLRDAEALLARHGWRVVQRQFALRWGDRGGGRFNRLLNRLPARWVERLAPVREFLTYQVELRAERA